MDEQELIAEIEKSIKRLSGLLEKTTMQITSIANYIPCKELSKYNRRVEYHKRLSERNRLHPKKKPRGCR